MECQGIVSHAIDVANSEGRVEYTESGAPADKTQLKRDVCKRLGGFEDTQGAGRYACLVSDLRVHGRHLEDCQGGAHAVPRGLAPCGRQGRAHRGVLCDADRPARRDLSWRFEEAGTSNRGLLRSRDLPTSLHEVSIVFLQERRPVRSQPRVTHLALGPPSVEHHDKLQSRTA